MKRPAPPLATLALTAAILAVYGIELAGDGAQLCQRYGFVAADPTLIAAVSALLLHDPASWGHIAGNLTVLLFVGSLVERTIGSTRFAAIYLAGGLVGAALHIVVDPTSTVPLVGCSGALFAVLAVAAARIGPGMLAFVAVLIAGNILHAFGGPGADGVSFACHLGGFFAGTVAVGFARLRGVELRPAVAA